MKRTKFKKVIGILCTCVVLLVAAFGVITWQHYRQFRASTNYQFASVADAFYQMFSQDKPMYHFVNQNVAEYDLGERCIRTMAVDRTMDATQSAEQPLLIQAVGVDTLFGTYYQFFDVHADMAKSRYYKLIISGEERTAYVGMRGMKCDGGVIIQLVTTEHYRDNYGEPIFTFETAGNRYTVESEAQYVEYFWIEGDLPHDYVLTCENPDLAGEFDMDYAYLTEQTMD